MQMSWHRKIGSYLEHEVRFIEAVKLGLESLDRGEYAVLSAQVDSNVCWEVSSGSEVSCMRLPMTGIHRA
jgi:hypothetical protein